MLVFRNIFFLAVAAGLLAGLAMTALQSRFTVPLILAAETYETAAPAAHAHDAATPAHAHEPEAWAPADGFQRTAFTIAANVVTAVGFGAPARRRRRVRRPVRRRPGRLAQRPPLGPRRLRRLHARPRPRPPARAARHARRRARRAPGLVDRHRRRHRRRPGDDLPRPVPPPRRPRRRARRRPHLVGAPQPESHASPIPADLHHRFVVAVTITNLVFWALLGTLAGALRPRVEAWLASPKLA